MNRIYRSAKQASVYTRSRQQASVHRPSGVLTASDGLSLIHVGMEERVIDCPGAVAHVQEEMFARFDPEVDQSHAVSMLPSLHSRLVYSRWAPGVGILSRVAHK